MLGCWDVQGSTERIMDGRTVGGQREMVSWYGGVDMQELEKVGREERSGGGGLRRPRPRRAVAHIMRRSKKRK